jgi:hypothetical protein
MNISAFFAFIFEKTVVHFENNVYNDGVGQLYPVKTKNLMLRTVIAGSDPQSPLVTAVSRLRLGCL